MKPGRPCQHCSAHGCAIYANRPVDPCVNFVCGWLAENSALPEHMRPDRAGVIVLMNQQWHDWKVIKAVAAGHSIPPDSLGWLKTHAENTRTPLIFYEYLFENGRFKGQKATGFGPRAFVEHVRNAIGPQDIVTF